MEGVATNVRWLFQTTEKFVGRRLDPVRLIGGGAASDLWCAIFADVLDRTIEQVDDPLYCGLRGAALIAGVALGEIKRSEVGGLVPVRATYRPDPADRVVYDRAFRAFPKLHATQKKIFRRK